MKKLIAIAASAAAAASFATPAHATETKSVEVSFADLNLRNDEGVARFDRRIERAIDQVCDYDGNLADRLNHNASKACVRETLANVTPARNAIIDTQKNGQVTVFASLKIERPVL